jgi:hypothetical protein
MSASPLRGEEGTVLLELAALAHLEIEARPHTATVACRAPRQRDQK